MQIVHTIVHTSAYTCALLRLQNIFYWGWVVVRCFGCAPCVSCTCLAYNGYRSLIGGGLFYLVLFVHLVLLTMVIDLLLGCGLS